MVSTSATHSRVVQIENSYIIYDAQLAEQITTQWFDSAYWHEHGELQQVGTGRGQAWFIHADGENYVLRHYRRGGLIARLSADHYVWLGLRQTRAWREYALLVKLQELGLPAPQPVAAQVRRHGRFYTADLLLRRIPESESLSHVLTRHVLDSAQWQDIGRCIRRFHEHNICHADLNAHNILLDGDGQVFLIDFDKGTERQGSGWRRGNLMRLQRSLRKLSTQLSDFQFREKDWQALMAGYDA